MSAWSSEVREILEGDRLRIAAPGLPPGGRRAGGPAAELGYRKAERLGLVRDRQWQTGSGSGEGG